jgi:peptidoglycan glycosyltransferase
VADAARTAGISAPLDAPTEGIALGNKEVSALELASAYATIAAGGVWHPPHLVSRVVTADDRVLYEADPAGERRFPEQVARNVTEAMLDVARRDGLALGRRPVAAKTGTVQSRLPGENNDAWMAGFTPQLASSVWLGTDRNSPIRTAAGAPISGRTVPGEVWRTFMASALRTAPAEPFPPFRPVGTPPSAPPARPDPPSPPSATSVPSAAPSAVPEATDPVADPVGGPTLAGAVDEERVPVVPPVDLGTEDGPARGAVGRDDGGPSAPTPTAVPLPASGDDPALPTVPRDVRENVPEDAPGSSSDD